MVLVFVRVRSGASAQLSGAVSVENPDSYVLVQTITHSSMSSTGSPPIERCRAAFTEDNSLTTL